MKNKGRKNSFEDDLLFDDNYGSNSNFSGDSYGMGSGDEFSTDWRPQQMDSNTFKQRNDPSNILHYFRLELMQAYEVEEIIKDPETGDEKKVKKIKHKANVEPLANKQGVEEIISYLRKFINNHTVQANLTSTEEYNKRLKIISNNLCCHFISNRIAWGISLQNIDILITYTTELIDMFYTRTLMDKERSHYGEGFKDTTHREFRPQEKTGAFQKFAHFLSGGKK